MAAPESLLEMSHNFGTELKTPWLDDEEIVPMDIYTACSIGQYDVVQEYLSINTDGENINKHNTGGWTPLMYAAYVGHDTVVNLLLDDGLVSVDARTLQKGATALMLAASCGNEPVVYFLIQSRADINAMDMNGETALLYATHQGHQNVVKMLIDSGADLEKSENKGGFTPLLDAAREGHEGIFNLLLQSGSDPRTKTTQGEDARQLALRYGHMPIVNLIDMQSHKQAPHSLLRSEAGLGSDLMFYPELGNSPDTKVNDWLGNYRVTNSPKIQDGPELFALLRNQQSNLPSIAKSPITSPAKIPVRHPKVISNHLLGTPHGSFEDYFFANSGGTVKSTSLDRHFEDLNLDVNSCESPHLLTPEFPLISTFLQDLKLTKYIPVFEDQEVDFETLLALTDADLKEIGINLFGPRRKILTGVASWKEHNPTTRNGMKKLEAEVNELNVSLQNAWLQIQQYQAQCVQERELRAVLEGHLVGERIRFQQGNAEVRSTLKQVLSELENMKKIAEEMGQKEGGQLQIALDGLRVQIGGLVKKFLDSEMSSKTDKKPASQCSSSSQSDQSSAS